ncbi:MAG: F0F1 ATP synthase subunit A, partial [Chloroflexi bacterium]|nr:F0F1 ATP synthase subunit A [Chloroflexota bacterium]
MLSILVTRRLQMVPERRSWQVFGEVVIGSILNIAESAVGRSKARLIFPLMGTLFIFIITANWFSLFPLIGPF